MSNFRLTISEEFFTFTIRLAVLFTEWSEYSDSVLIYCVRLQHGVYVQDLHHRDEVDLRVLISEFVTLRLHVVELLHLLVEINHVDLKEFVLNFEAMNSLFWSSKSSFLSVLASATSGSSSSSRRLSRSTDFYFLKPHVFRRENATKFRAKSKDLNRKLHWNQRLI